MLCKYFHSEVTFIKHHKSRCGLQYRDEHESKHNFTMNSLQMLAAKDERVKEQQRPMQVTSKVSERIILSPLPCQSAKEEKFLLLLIKFIAARAIRCDCVSTLELLRNFNQSPRKLWKSSWHCYRNRNLLLIIIIPFASGALSLLLFPFFKRGAHGSELKWMAESE